MSNNIQQQGEAYTGAIGFCSFLGLLFIGLKLTGHITWAWLWVLAPLWIPVCVVLVVFVILAIILVSVRIYTESVIKKHRRDS